MLRYPLGGRAHIYINNHDLSEFCAKLATDYSISGYELTNTYHQGPDRSSFALLRQTHGRRIYCAAIGFLRQKQAGYYGKNGRICGRV